MTTLAKSNTGSTSVPSTKLEKLAGEINERCAAARESVTSAVYSALQAGALLNEAKTLIPHGEWLPWLQKNVTVTDRQAQKWMRVAREWTAIESNTNCDSYLTIERGLELIAEPRQTGSDRGLEAAMGSDGAVSAVQPAASSDNNGSTWPSGKESDHSLVGHSGGTTDLDNSESPQAQNGRNPVSSSNGESLRHKTPPDKRAPRSAIEDVEQATRGVARMVGKAEKATGGRGVYSKQAIADLGALYSTLHNWKNDI